jgi:hypothetical protein
MSFEKKRVEEWKLRQGVIFAVSKENDDFAAMFSDLSAAE